MMKTGCTGTERPTNGTGGLRRVVLALAVLLLTCVLMAGAVSADDDVATVDNYDALIAALADDNINSITLTANIDATAEILVNRSVTIDGGGFTIKATAESWPTTGNTEKHLLGIMKKTGVANDITVTLKNLKLDSASKAMGLNIFEPGETVTLTDLTLTNSAGSGITINGATVKASGLTISGSKWGQSIDVGLGTAENVKTSSLTLYGTNTLSDVYQINTDNPDAVTVTAPGYKSYDWFYDYTDNSGYHPYAHYKSTWTTKSDFTTVDLPKEADKKAPVLVLNSSTATPALHKDLVNATKYVEDGATIQLLGDVELKETAEIFNKVTLDLNGKTITRTDETALRLIGSNADVTLSDKSGKNTGTVKAVTTHSEVSPWAVGVNVTQGKLTVDTGVTILASHMGIRTHGSQTDIPGYSKVTLNSGATINAAYGIYIYRNDTSTGNDAHAYGAVVDVYGTIECLDASHELKGWKSNGAPGIFVDGNVLDQSGNLMQLHIYEGAKIIAKGAPAIAGNGMANITINGGTLTGDEALGVKSGNWIINGGTFTANGEYHNPAITDNSGTDATGAAVGVTTTYTGPISLTIRGGEFLSQNGDALSIFKIPGKAANVKNLVIEGGVFSTQSSSRLGMEFYNDTSNNEPFIKDATISIIGGKYTPGMNITKIVAPYEVIQDGAYKTVARIESSPTAEVKPEASGAQNVTVSAPETPGKLQLETTGAPSAESVTLNVSGNTDVKLILHAKEGETLTIDETNNSVIGNVTKVTYIPNETVLQNTDNVSFKMHFNVQDLAKVLNGGIKIQVTNSPASGDYTGTYARAFSVTILSTDGAELHNTDVELGYTQKSGYTYKVIHAKDGSRNNVVFTYAGGKFKFIAPSFSSYVITETPTPASTSSGGSSAYSFRVLFNDGSTTLSVVTDLSYGDKLTKPETPVKDGYTFAGWYKDSACTQAWDFETGIPGDMTLYAKWTAAGSSGETEATTAPTATSTAVTTPQPTKTQSTTATTSAPEATTAAGVSPTLTQAPAPVAGALFGLLAAGVLLRRRFQ